jgi:hypothetical protein
MGDAAVADDPLGDGGDRCVPVDTGRFYAQIQENRDEEKKWKQS